MSQLPVVATAPEAAMEKAVSIGTWAVAMGLPTHVGVVPPVTGSPLVWSAEMEGKTMVFVKGFITSIEPFKKLVYTVTDPNASWEDIPENYLNVTYTLSPVNGETLLTVRQDGFETAAEGEKRYREVSNNGEGWTPILVQIKNLLEAE